MFTRLALRTASSASRSSVKSTRLFHSTLRRDEIFKKANAETFKKATSNEDNIVLVDFYADWCNPCKMISPILEKIANDPHVKTATGSSVDLVTVDADEESSLCGEYDVRALPTVVAFRDGKPVSKFVGALPEAQIRAFLQSI